MERANEAALTLSGLALGGVHGSSRKGYRRVRDPTALSPAHHAVLTAALQQEVVCCVCNSTRLHKVGMRAGGCRGRHRMSGLHARALWVLELGVNWEVSGLSKLMSRSGRPLHLNVSSFWTPGFSHLPHTHGWLGLCVGAYRHRASEQELRDCGGSGFIFGGLDCESRL